MELKPIKELERQTPEQKIAYFRELRDYCQELGRKREEFTKKNIGRTVLLKAYNKFLTGYDYHLEGLENIPETGPALFVCNHSNSHDFFAAQEVFRRLGRRVSILSGEDCLNRVNQQIFKICDARPIDRRDSNSTSEGLMLFAGDIANGMWGFLFPESTWNMHPIKTMQQIKIGATLTTAIADAPIIPVNFEYVEVPHIVTKETDLYKECRVRFNKPIKIDCGLSLITQSGRLLSTMRFNRRELWTDLGIKRNTIGDIDPKIYLNHKAIAKFFAFGFKYDSAYEDQFLYKPKGIPFENEYHLDEFGNFVPGIITLEEAKRYVKKM